MMKSKIFDEYLDLVRESYEYNGYPFPENCDCFGYNSPYCCMTDLKDEDLSRLKLDFECGASKGCVLSKYEKKYVLKVPFLNIYDEDEGREIDFNNAYLINPATNQYIFSNNRDDYCYLEKYMSDVFVKSGLGNCICKVESYGDIDGHPLYIQERATEFENTHSSTRSIDECKDFVETMKSSYGEEKYFLTFEDEWAMDFVDYHGEDKYVQMIDILAAYGVNDLHLGNYGYVNDRPVLIDYSGYKD